MVAETAKLIGLPAREAARVLIQHADEEWLFELQRSLDRRRTGADLDRVLTVWNLSQSDAAKLFHITRQAIGKWRTLGVPRSQVEAVANLGAATDLLIRHLKRERIAAVVRRPAVRLGGMSLLDLVGAGRTREILVACREMFQFGDAHA